MSKNLIFFSLIILSSIVFSSCGTQEIPVVQDNSSTLSAQEITNIPSDDQELLNNLETLDDPDTNLDQLETELNQSE